jgi:site-specific DNA recombinase
MDVIKNSDAGEGDSPRRLAADTVEGAIINEICPVLRTREAASQVLATVARDGHYNFAWADVIAALQGFQGLSGQLFLVQPARIFHLLVRRVTVTTKGLVLDLRADETSGVMRNLMMPHKTEAAA